MRRPRAAIVISAHGTDVSFHRRKSAKGRLFGAYLRLGAILLRQATIISNSSATAQVAAETGWRSATVIPLATSIEALPAPQGHAGALLFAGRLIERKGCAWFIRNVMPLLPPHIRLKVAGTIWVEAERAALDDPRVSYLGPLATNALTEEYRRALCVIVPNIDPPSGEFEGFGLVAPEAAAAGGVVVAAATGGLTDAVIDGQTGFLVPPADAEAWASKIAEIARWSGEQRAAFTSAAMEMAREQYSWERVTEEVLRVYERATAASPT
jgi:glycosyltransferase involved in cell wall biosynthesis